MHAQLIQKFASPVSVIPRDAWFCLQVCSFHRNKREGSCINLEVCAAGLNNEQRYRNDACIEELVKVFLYNFCSSTDANHANHNAPTAMCPENT